MYHAKIILISNNKAIVYILHVLLNYWIHTYMHSASLKTGCALFRGFPKFI